MSPREEEKQRPTEVCQNTLELVTSDVAARDPVRTGRHSTNDLEIQGWKGIINPSEDLGCVRAAGIV